MGDTPRRAWPATILKGLAKSDPELVRQTIKRLLNECETRAEVADILGVSRPTFYKVVKELGIHMPLTPKTLPVSRASLIIEVNRARGNLSEVARHLGVARSTVNRWVDRYKLRDLIRKDHWDE